MQFVDFDWPANILAGLNFRAQENRLMSPDGLCAGHETSNTTVFVWVHSNSFQQ